MIGLKGTGAVVVVVRGGKMECGGCELFSARARDRVQWILGSTFFEDARGMSLVVQVDNEMVVVQDKERVGTGSGH